jgi:hypothetical protein
VFKALSTVNQALGTIVSLLVVALLGGVGYLGYSYLGQREAFQRELADRDARIQALNDDLETKRREIQQLQTALRLLKVDHRVAVIDVLKQTGSKESKDLRTQFAFTELDAKGNPLDKARAFTVDGDLAYIDSLVVKFTDEAVETADPLRSTSLCLFRRVFGENQKPADGFALDAVGAQPARYRDGREPPEFEKELWRKFWDYASNPEEARKKGIRAAHGEAPFQKLVPGKRYRVLLRSSGGLTFEPDASPAQTPGPTS